ncbi:MAG: hypothetical protein BEN19_06125 [Epulopiscium sp. Nuni2H_MBin003]|nr:MAG: hypothetical protein BEN19_06125 [Epulopiscium sp. Nuni2H_MBin003]
MTKRLLGIVKYVPQNSKVADIGTDHGYVAKYLIDNNIASSVIASDINTGPLEIAKSNTKHLSNIELRISNGLSNYKLSDNIDTIIIAGMGGYLITEILSNNIEISSNATRLILQPQNAHNKVRKFLHEKGFKIIDETFLEDMEKYYTIIVAEKGLEIYDKECYYEYGFHNIKEGNIFFRKFLSNEQKKFELITKQLATEGAESDKLQQDIQIYKETIKCIQ